MEPSKPIRTGPFEEGSWPDRLRASAVAPGPPPRLYGYDIERDLARHYGLAEVMLLALTGTAPDEATGKAFEIALIFASACPINEAPTHGAALSRVMGAPVANALQAGCVIGCEAAHKTVADHQELLAWLAGDRVEPLPDGARATTPRDTEGAEALRRALATAATSAAPPEGASRAAAIICVLWACGLRSDDALVAALSWAKVVSIAAEAVANRRGELTNLPNRLPDFRYVAPEP